MAANEQPQNIPVGERGREAAPMSVIPEPIAGLLIAGIVNPPPQPGLLGKLDKYELVRVLGQGGMGIVFLARDTETGAKVAIKLPRRELAGDTELVSLFLREAKRLQQLKHPNLVSVLDARQLKQGAFFVMPYFDRGSLAERIKPGVPLPREVILEILLPVAEALKVIHAEGFTHRDIKPGNILLGSDGTVCLADFGLARTVLNDSVIQPRKEQCEGTPPYMSPQMAAGEKEDTRCDIYAFGALLYETLTGKPPYQGRTTREIRDRILAGPPKPIAELNPSVDPGLVSLAEAAMAREQRDRYASMADVAADLRRVAEAKVPLGPHGLGRGLRLPLIPLRTATRRSVAVMAFVVCLSTAFWIVWPHSRLRVIHSFTSPQVPNWANAEPATLTGLPGKELLVANGHDVFCFSASGDSLSPWPWSSKVPGSENSAVVLVTDVNEDGLDEAFVSWTSGTNLGISVVNANAFELARFTANGEPLSSKNRHVTSYLHPLCFVRAAESWDKRPKLLAALDINFGGDTNIPQRSLCCFDYHTGSNEWQYPVGPRISQAELCDLDGDGRKEIVCGTASPGNGYRGLSGQDDDSHCYVYAFSGKGELLWRTNLSGEYSFSRVFPVGLDAGGHQQLVAWVHTDEFYHATNGLYRSKLVRLDHHGHVLDPQYQPGPCIKSCLPVEFRKGGPTHIVCADCEGYVHFLKPDLTFEQKALVYMPGPQRAGTLDCAEARLIKAGRFIAGEEKQVALEYWSNFSDGFTNAGRHDKPMDKTWCERAEIVLLDEGLEVKGRYRSTGRTSPGPKWVAKAADMDGDSLDEILLLNDHVEILKFR